MDYIKHCIGVMYEADTGKEMVVDIQASLRRLYNEYNDDVPPPPPAPNTVQKKSTNKLSLNDSKNHIRMTYLKGKRVKAG